MITLKQGFGRLIRSLRDRGMLMLLDPRIQRQRYGRIFLDSLPPYRLTQSIEDVEAFFAPAFGSFQILPSSSTELSVVYLGGTEGLKPPARFSLMCEGAS